MKKLLWILWVFFYCIAQAHGSQWRFPGEFEKQEAVWAGFQRLILRDIPQMR